MIRRRQTAAVLTFLAATAAACTPDGGPLEVTLRPTADGQVLFLSLPTRPNAVMEALFDGTVSVDAAGCIRLQSGTDGATVVWPYGSTLVRRGSDLAVVDEAGRDIGVLGGHFRFGGGFVSAQALASFASTMQAAATQRCPGAYWIVGEILR